MTMRERSQRRIEEDRARLQAIFDSHSGHHPDRLRRTGHRNEQTMATNLDDGRYLRGGKAGEIRRRLAGSKERLKRDEWPIARAFRGESIIDEEIEIQRFGRFSGHLASVRRSDQRSRRRIIGAVSDNRHHITEEAGEGPGRSQVRSEMWTC